MPVGVLQDVVEESGQVADAEPDVLQHDRGEVVRAQGLRILCRFGGGWRLGVYYKLSLFAIFLGSL